MNPVLCLMFTTAYPQFDCIAWFIRILQSPTGSINHIQSQVTQHLTCVTHLNINNNITLFMKGSCKCDCRALLYRSTISHISSIRDLSQLCQILLAGRVNNTSLVLPILIHIQQCNIIHCRILQSPIVQINYISYFNHS